MQRQAFGWLKFACGGIALVLVADVVEARTWLFETEAHGNDVQAIADSAANGDTLLFTPGVHEVELLLIDKVLVLIGQGGAGAVTLARTPEYVIYKPGLIRVESTTGGSFRAIGLTFRDGYSYGRVQAGAISLSGVTNVWIEGCAFVNNQAVISGQAKTNRGGAVQVAGATAVTIKDCTFDDNQTMAGNNYDSSGGAISIAAAGAITLTGSRFTGNSSEGSWCGGYGGAAVLGASTVMISDCEFRENRASNGGAMYAGGTITMERCKFIDNLSYAGGSPCGQPAGSVVNLAGSVTIRESVWLDNGGSGTALQISGGASLRIERSTVAFNGQPGTLRPAVNISGSEDPTPDFQRNLVAFNHGPGIVHNVAASSRVACNIIWGNSPDFPGGTDWRGSFDNQASDPLFCSTSEPGITVAENSPCLAGGAGHPESCGVIGVVEAGCTAVSVTPTTWSAIKAWRGR